MRHLALLFAASFSLSLEASELPGQQWPMAGKVIYVSDGDTLTILQSDFSKLTVRLSDIDAPETSHGNHRPGQPYSQASKQSLAELAKGKQATATCYEFDRHERPVCTVLVNGQNVNAEQLRRGMAWANHASRRYVRDPQTYTLEAQAKAVGLGLWSTEGPQPVPPWEWRRQCWTNKACAGAGE